MCLVHASIALDSLNHRIVYIWVWRVSMCADDPKILKGKMASSLNIFIEQLMRNRSSSLPFIYFDLVVGNMMYVFG